MCANVFALLANARNEEPYIMISMDDVASDGFRHLILLLRGDGTIGFEIRNKKGRMGWRKWRSPTT